MLKEIIWTFEGPLLCSKATHASCVHSLCGSRVEGQQRRQRNYSPWGYSSVSPIQLHGHEMQPVQDCIYGSDRGQLREVAAYNAIISVHNAVKDVAVAKQNNWAHGHSQATHTPYHKLIRDAECKQSSTVAEYHSAQTAMISLSLIQEDDDGEPLITNHHHVGFSVLPPQDWLKGSLSSRRRER